MKGCTLRIRRPRKTLLLPFLHAMTRYAVVELSSVTTWSSPGRRHHGSYVDTSSCTHTVLASFLMQSCHAARVQSAESGGYQDGLSLESTII